MMRTAYDDVPSLGVSGSRGVMYEKVLRIGRPDSDWRVYVDGRPTFASAPTLREAMAIGRRATDETNPSEHS